MLKSKVIYEIITLLLAALETDVRCPPKGGNICGPGNGCPLPLARGESVAKGASRLPLVFLETNDMHIANVHIDAEKLNVDFMDGRSVSVPLA